MGTISTNRLGGASLIVGPLLAVVCFLIRPGGGLVGGQVDPADASASINVVTANADLAGISFLLAPIGLLALVYGLNVFAESLKGGNGEALARYGTLFFLLALMSWSVGSALTVAIAGGAVQHRRARLAIPDPELGQVNLVGIFHGFFYQRNNFSYVIPRRKFLHYTTIIGV